MKQDVIKLQPIRNRGQATFLAAVVGVFILLNLLVGILLINWSHWISIVQLIVLQVMNIGIAYGIVEISFTLLAKGEWNAIPRASMLSTQPRVALLYLTCDDLVLEAAQRIGEQTYPYVEVFVLDDSRLPIYRKQVDRLGWQVIRRTGREGFKAGSINHWLEQYGKSFDYFVILDSDSILGRDFVTEMLLYAEHSSNENVAIFQSMTSIWNCQHPFARAFSTWEPIWQYPFARLANFLDTALSVGHNCLCRVSALNQVGNFCTDYIAEDYATSIKLMQQGQLTRLVPVFSFEAAPVTVRSFTGRNIRWAEQTLDLFHLDITNIPWTTQLHVFMNFYSFAVWLFYLPGMILSLFGFHTTFQDVRNLFMLVSSRSFDPAIAVPYGVLLAIYLYFFLSRFPIARINRISWKSYFSNLILFIAMSSYIIIPQNAHLLAALFRKKPPDFTITDKRPESISLWQILTDHGGAGFFVVMFVAAGVLYNPISLLWNFPWILPMLLSPFILAAAHRERSYPDLKER